MLGVALVATTGPAFAKPANSVSDLSPGWSALGADIEQHRRDEHIPGMAVSVVRNGEVIWARGFGYADVRSKSPVTPDTIFVMASVSKAVLAMALMHAAERGSLSLDADINAHLPFEVRHPDHPDRPITARQLATHTSGIVDNDAVYESPINYHFGADNPLALGEFLAGYLRKGGVYYDPQLNFSRFAPGAHWEYSNVGAGLAGYLIESAAAVPLDVYCRKYIFTPLGMNSTGWHLSEVDTSRLAVPYAEKQGEFQAHGSYGLATWPDGGLRTTARDLGRFLAMVMQGGALGTVRVVAPDTVAAMLESQGVSASTPRFPGRKMPQGIFWYRLFDGEGTEKYWGHWGSDPGAVTVMAFDPQRRVGAIVLVNVDANASRAVAMQDIVDRLIVQGGESKPARARSRAL